MKDKEREQKVKQQAEEDWLWRLREDLEEGMAAFRAAVAAMPRAVRPSSTNDEMSPPTWSPVTFLGLLTSEGLEMITKALNSSVPPA